MFGCSRRNLHPGKRSSATGCHLCGRNGPKQLRRGAAHRDPELVTERSFVPWSRSRGQPLVLRGGHMPSGWIGVRGRPYIRISYHAVSFSRPRAFPSYPNSRLVSAVSEVVLALLGRELVEMPTDGLPESLLGAGGGLSEQLFQLCEELLDGVQVRRVGWQIQQARARCLDRFLHAFHFVDRKIVHQNRLPRLEFRRQHLLDVNPERVTVHGTIDYERCDDPTGREA